MSEFPNEREYVERLRAHQRLVSDRMTASAPYPVVLAELVRRVTFKSGWTFGLHHGVHDEGKTESLRLEIVVVGPNSYDPDRSIGVVHPFIVPAATYDEKTWIRWVFDCCLLVETHEAGEWFKVDGSRPFAPLHGPGKNPYSIHERSTEHEVRTLSSGHPNPNGDAV